LLTFGLFLNRSDKVFGDFKVDVCFQKRQANLAQRRLDVFLRQHAFAAQIFQRPL